MSKTFDERKRLLVKICNLYYVDGLNQQEISDRLGISRPKVSRMLSAAKTEGIVSITIKNPFAEEQKYESAIEKTFGIKDAIVVNTGDSSPAMNRLLLGDACAAFLESSLKDNEIVSVMAGKTIHSLCERIEYFPRQNLIFVPAIGGWGHEGTDYHANSNAKILGEKLKSKYFILNAPSIVASIGARDVLMSEPEISSVLSLARNSTTALIGIGQVSSEATMIKTGIYSDDEVEAIKKAGGVASICTWFIDINGNSIDFPAKPRLVGLTDEELRRIPMVIGVASGLDKAEAILGTLRGGWVNVLVTDIKTAKAVLDMQGVNI